MLKNFSKLSFEEKSHTYELEGRKLPSVSGLVESFYEPFDPSVAKFSAIKYKTTEKKILAQWKRAKTLALNKGNRVHHFAERYAECIQTGNCKDIIPKTKDEFAIVEFFFKHRSYEIVAIEQKVFSKKYKYAGTFDLLLRHKKTKKLIIVDWKTNKDIYKNYKGKKLYRPFNQYLDQPLTHYYIQLNLYQLCLEEAGYQVSERWIYWTTEGKLIKAPNLCSKLKQHYGKRV